MATTGQIRLVQIARRKVGLNELQYRTLLRTTANVNSSTRLGNSTLEDVMAVLEDLGFRMPGKPADYWRSKVQRRGGDCGDRVVWKMNALAPIAEIELAGFCRRMSSGRTDRPEELDPREAYNVIEALKKIIAREPEPALAGAEDDLPF